MTDDSFSTDELASAINSSLLISSLPPPPKPSSSPSPSPASIPTKKSSAQPPKTSPPKHNRWSLLPPTTLHYGHFSTNPNPTSPTGFYITTAINYTNGPAHMGHAYESVTTDALARYHRLTSTTSGAYFVTGADEHGQKVKKTAESEHCTPLQLCDKYVLGFRCLNQRLLISNDDYVRTTSSRHKATAQRLWKLVEKDIYLDTYAGWYNIKEEAFVTDSDAALWDYKDPSTGIPLKRVEEESYFFKMSEYHDWLVEHIETHPEFILPEFQRNAILGRLKRDSLRDLSVSRTTFDWGIKVPEGFDEKHVMYVWVDALSNYLTGVDALGLEEGGSTTLAGYWPADVHIIGKDILWFHTVIWPTLLHAAGIPLPKTVFAHGFVNDKDGKKMSKSLGNVIDPHDMLDRYSVDTFRWYLCKEAPYGGELSFSERSMMDMHNADLADTLGNLIHRGTNLCLKYCGGVVVDVGSPEKLPVEFDGVRKEFVEKMDKFELEGGAGVAMQALRDVNGYLTEMAPWHMKGEEMAERRKVVVRATLEAIYAIAHLLTPFLVDGSRIIFDKLNTDPVTLDKLRGDLRNLKVGTKIDVGDILYAKIQSEEELQNAAEAAKTKSESHIEAQKRKKEKKQQQQKAAAAANAPSNQPDFTKLDIRVGKITKVWHHPDADKLFCEEVDIGEECPKQIASGLRDHYDIKEMEDRLVLVVCNLKPAKLAGFTSSGMVLAAKAEKKVELVDPPSNSKIGERIVVEGLEDGEPVSAAQVKKKKVWEEVAKGLKTTEGGVAMWEGKVIKTSAGECRVKSLVGAPIS